MWETWKAFQIAAEMKVLGTNGGRRQSTGFVLFGIRQEVAPVIFKDLMLPNGSDHRVTQRDSQRRYH
ncbi:unnamed protein product [Schistosoma margrebowiei]|uniref:Uncharacterized protein n=1 Tax=Schistosoma margrebowiei TaxID=48269 RepID=A0A183LQB0_9TREM|nr:unnamed protein product [Schistosoma margrebowiei]